LEWWPDIKLIIKPSPYRSIASPLFAFLDEYDQQENDGQLAAIILPEIVPSKWWYEFLHNQTATMIKFLLLYKRRIYGYQRFIIEVPYHLEK